MNGLRTLPRTSTMPVRISCKRINYMTFDKYLFLASISLASYRSSGCKASARSPISVPRDTYRCCSYPRKLSASNAGISASRGEYAKAAGTYGPDGVKYGRSDGGIGHWAWHKPCNLWRRRERDCCGDVACGDPTAAESDACSTGWPADVLCPGQR